MESDASKAVVDDLCMLRDDLRKEIEKMRGILDLAFADNASLVKTIWTTGSEVSALPDNFDPVMEVEEVRKELTLDNAAELKQKPSMSKVKVPEAKAKESIDQAKDRLKTVLHKHENCVRGITPRFNETVVGIDDWKTGHVECNIKALVAHPIFDTATAFVILCNAVMIGAEVQVTALIGVSPPEFTILGQCFNVFFLLELLVRLFAFKLFFFKDPENAAWNYFDLALVLLATFDTIILLSGVDLGASSMVFTSVKTMKMFRILRLFRVFRFSRKLSELATMITDSLNALLWAVVMMVLIIYIFAIIIASNSGTWLTSQLDPHGEGLNWLSIALESGDENIQEVARRFGTLSSTANTLLQIMLGGSDWGDIVDMSGSTGSLVPLLLYIYVAFTMLAVLNVVTGVFVDNALENTKKQQQYQIDQAKDAEQDMLQQMTAFFEAVDTDGDGCITSEELMDMSQHDDLLTVLAIWGFRSEDVLGLYDLLDTDGSGTISFTEFSEAIDRLRGPARAIDLHFLSAQTKALSEKM
mmetsp:Transcript_102657/g.182388  ORF Transcript_102657/g.182388 Transcript_102657/m.182388 type:complete len:528 (+) Transcript_102657:29-1612(+)